MCDTEPGRRESGATAAAPRETTRARAAAALRRLYDGLGRELALEAEQQAQVLQLLINQQIEQLDTFRQFAHDPAAMNQAMTELLDRNQTALMTALGDKYLAFEDYQKSLGERMQIEQAALQLEAAGVPLRDEQRRRVLDVMVDERERTPRPAWTAGTSPEQALAQQREWQDDGCLVGRARQSLLPTGSVASPACASRRQESHPRGGRLDADRRQPHAEERRRIQRPLRRSLHPARSLQSDPPARSPVSTTSAVRFNSPHWPLETPKDEELRTRSSSTLFSSSILETPDRTITRLWSRKKPIWAATRLRSGRLRPRNPNDYFETTCIIASYTSSFDPHVTLPGSSGVGARQDGLTPRRLNEKALIDLFVIACGRAIRRFREFAHVTVLPPDLHPVPQKLAGVLPRKRYCAPMSVALMTCLAPQ